MPSQPQEFPIHPLNAPLGSFWADQPDDNFFGTDSSRRYLGGVHGVASGIRGDVSVSDSVASNSPTPIPGWHEIPSKSYSAASRAPNIPPSLLECTIEEAMRGCVERADAPAFTVPTATNNEGPIERKVKKATVRFGVRPTY